VRAAVVVVAQLSVEALDVAVLHRPAWTDEVQGHTVVKASPACRAM
jgi:hypothetical protein